MNINQLILIIKDKITKNLIIQEINIEDKTFLHKKHKTHTDGKFHIKLVIKSEELKTLNRIDSSKKIYNIIDSEIKKYIHSIQVLIE